MTWAEFRKEFMNAFASKQREATVAAYYYFRQVLELSVKPGLLREIDRRAARRRWVDVLSTQEISGGPLIAGHRGL